MTGRTDLSVNDERLTTPLDGRELARIRDMLDKQAIHENMVKYTRALDRYDLDRIKDAYWPDALDDHGKFVGTAYDFAESAYAMRKLNVVKSCLHLIGNTQIELDGTLAKAEFAFLSVAVFVDPDGEGDRDFINIGRYRDLCERRGDEWKILRRTVIWDWCSDQPTSANWARFLPADFKNFGADFPDDPVYQEW